MVVGGTRRGDYLMGCILSAYSRNLMSAIVLAICIYPDICQFFRT